MASKTLCGSVGYADHLLGRTVDEWVRGIHRYNCEKNNWEYRPLRPGAFGYDNLAMSIRAIEDASELGPEGLSALVHAGWARNYIAWRDVMAVWNEEDLRSRGYFPPYTPLGDERRDRLAVTPYADLPEVEKAKDRLIAEYIAANAEL